MFKKVKEYAKTIVSINNVEYECKVAHQQPITSSLSIDQNEPKLQDGILTFAQAHTGMVVDGTKCGDNMICYNNSCVGIEQFIEPGDCPTDNVAITCSGHGVSTKKRLLVFKKTTHQFYSKND